MRPFYFGSGRRLYGVLHEPPGSAKSTGVLLCYPGVQEYNMTHWAFRKLAGLLSREGLAVMRFDYSCSGDSEGDVYDGRVDHWVEDVATAADELKDAAGVRRVSIIGMRLGALIATQAVAGGVKASDLVLWEPIFRGVDYIADLERLDDDISRRWQQRVSTPRIELAGYPFPSRMRASLSALELQRSTPKTAGRVSDAFSAPSPDATATQAAWESAGLKVSSQVVSEEGGGVTGNVGAGDAAILYTHVLNAITAELTQTRVAAA